MSDAQQVPHRSTRPLMGTCVTVTVAHTDAATAEGLIDLAFDQATGKERSGNRRTERAREISARYQIRELIARSTQAAGERNRRKIERLGSPDEGIGSNQLLLVICQRTHSPRSVP